MYKKLNQNGAIDMMVIAILVIVLALGGVLFYTLSGEDEAEPTETPVATVEDNTQEDAETQEEATEQESAGTVITTAESDFGTILFDGNNQAIYIWEVEETSEAECYDDCAVAWPPVLTDGDPKAMGGVDADLLGTTERTDGTTQVTYNDKPLYYYVDEGPGEVKCHNISTHGGLWWVIQPNGERAA